MNVLLELVRCAREIAEIELRPDVCDGTAPCYLSAMGRMDWELEADLIQSTRRVTVGKTITPLHEQTERAGCR